MNKVTVIGNLGGDPEMRYTPNGQEVTNFNVASNRRYKTASGETREETQWFSVSCFGRLATVAHEYLQKGRQVYLEGRLTLHAYIDRDGNPRASANLMASELQFLGQNDRMDEQNAPSGGNNPPRQQQNRRETQPHDTRDQGYNSGGDYAGDYGYEDADDLPF